MGRLDDIQTAIKPLKKSENIEIHFYTILELAESFKTMNRPDPTVTLFDGSFLGKHKIKERKILTQSLLKSSICAIKIWDRYI